jgi:hypothetical protein
MSNEHVPCVPALSHLSDDELLATLDRLAAAERGSTAQLVAHLAELDARRLYLGAGFSSLFAYCCGALRLSEHAAYNRIEAARAARVFPTIAERLAEGTLNLTSVRLLAPHLTQDNHRQLLDEASGRRRSAVEEIVARVSPKPDVASIVRRVPSAPAAQTESSQTAGMAAASSVPHVATATAVPLAQVAASTPRVTLVELRSRQPVVVLAPGRYEIRFTASAATREKLRAAQDLLRHAVPHGDIAEVIDRALTVLLDSLLKNKAAATNRPRSPASAGSADVAHTGSRSIPAAVRRGVWLRDGARCAFVAASGRRCGARAFLEFHHVKPYATAGQPTIDNIALRCHAHNQHERELAFGPRPTARPTFDRM